MSCIVNNNDCRGRLDPDHIKTRGSGGTDDDFNVMPLCRFHHTEKGKIGRVDMANKYPTYKKWLLKHNWEHCRIRNKWYRPIKD